MRQIPRRLDPVKFIQVGARIYAQIANREQPVPEYDINWFASKPSSGPTSAEAGAVKKAGGAIEKRGAAAEAQFFHKEQRKLLETLRAKLREKKGYTKGK